MNRTLMWLAATIVVLPHAASAAILQFIPGDVPADQPALTVLGDGIFELADTPNLPPNDFQFTAIQPFEVQVPADDGSGGMMPVTYSLARAATADGRVNLIFANDTYPNLLLWFDVAAISRGDAFPIPLTDDDGRLSWNAPQLTNGGVRLASWLEGGEIRVVPEPTGLVSLCAGSALLLLRRRRVT